MGMPVLENKTSTYNLFNKKKLWKFYKVMGG
jgi:hypothetical protein